MSHAQRPTRLRRPRPDDAPPIPVDDRAKAHAGPIEQHPLLHLQNAAGNRAVQRLVTGSTQRHPEGPHELPMATEQPLFTIPDIRIPPPGTGRAIPVRFRSRLETSFNVDFSGVRVREGRTAGELDAIAYTRGMDIEFAKGHYAPYTGTGRRLLAHELAHVVQQQAGRVPMPRDENVPATPYAAGVPLNNDRDLEAEASRQARKAAWGMPARIRGQRFSAHRPFIPVVQSSPVGRLAAPDE